MGTILQQLAKRTLLRLAQQRCVVRGWAPKHQRYNDTADKRSWTLPQMCHDLSRPAAFRPMQAEGRVKYDETTVCAQSLHRGGSFHRLSTKDDLACGRVSHDCTRRPLLCGTRLLPCVRSSNLHYCTAASQLAEYSNYTTGNDWLSVCLRTRGLKPRSISQPSLSLTFQSYTSLSSSLNSVLWRTTLTGTTLAHISTSHSC